MRQVEVAGIIAAGDTQSDAFEVKGAMMVGLLTGAGMDGTVLTPQVSFDGGTTWTAVFDQAGNAITITTTSSAFRRLLPSEWSFAEWIRFESNVTNVAELALTLIVLAD